MVDKLDQLLQLFRVDHPELTGPEIGRALQLPKTTTYRLLRRFVELGFVDRDRDSGRYRLGIRLAALGDLARHSTSLQRIAQPELRRLSQTTGEWGTLMVLSGTVAVVVEVVQSYRPLALPGLLGGPHPIHATAGGKVLVAWKSKAELRLYLTPPLKRYTPATITDRSVFQRELESVRSQGYAVVKGEWFEDMIGAAAPVRNHQGDIVAAVTIGCPYPRGRVGAKLTEIAAAVRETAARVSLALGCASIQCFV
jgi:DNA-binding IclR family transcriptional regulator